MKLLFIFYCYSLVRYAYHFYWFTIIAIKNLSHLDIIIP